VVDEHGFERLDPPVAGLKHEFDVRWKLLPATNGPPGYPGEPFIPLAVSFAMTSGERRRQGHLNYALGRTFWEEQHPPTATDGETLCRLVLSRLPADLHEIDTWRRSGGAADESHARRRI
jgi:hypothetical protein